MIMKTHLKCWLILMALSSNLLLFAQGNSQNSNGNNGNHNVCVPLQINGVKDPTAGIIERYSHNFSAHQGEQFVWTINGAVEVDGIVTDETTTYTTTKSGDFVDVIWGNQTPQGSIKAIPANPCAQVAQANNGIGKIITVKALCNPYLEVYKRDVNGDFTVEVTSDPSLCVGEEYLFIYRGACENFTKDYRFSFINAATLNGNSVQTGVNAFTTDEEIGVILSFLDVPNVFVQAEPTTNCGFCGTPAASIGFSMIQPYQGLSTSFSNPTIINTTCSYQNGIPNDIVFTLPNDPSVDSIVWYPFTVGGNSPTATLAAGSNLTRVACEVFHTNGCHFAYFWNVIAPPISSVLPLEVLCETTPDQILFANPYSFNGATDADHWEVRILSAGVRFGGAITNPAGNLNQITGGARFTHYLGTYGLGIPILPLGANRPSSVDVQYRIELEPCGWSAWQTQTLEFGDRITEPSFIEVEGIFCTGETVTLTTDLPRTGKERYFWSVAGTGTYTDVSLNPNTNVFELFVAVQGDPIIDVYVTDNCFFPVQTSGTLSENYNTSFGFLNAPAIVMPQNYCGGSHNTFEIDPATIETGVEYVWGFEYYIGNQQFILPSITGYEMTSYTPDFGAPSNSPVCDNGDEGIGLVNDFTVSVSARNCNWQTATISVTENNVDYTMCCNDGGGSSNAFSINLAPNPAHDQVNVYIPQGNGVANITITDAFGIVHKSINSVDNMETINTSNLPLGVYNVLVTKGSEIDMKHLQIIP